jgi:hypothetical protein
MARSVARQGIWIPSGVILLASAVGIPVAHHDLGWGLWVLVGCLALGGVYFIAASLTDAGWLPLPGDAAAKRERDRTEIAIGLLAEYQQSCATLRNRSVTDDQFDRWLNDLTQFVGTAWGPHRAASVGDGNKNDEHFYRFTQIGERITALNDWADSNPVRPTFSPETSGPRWLVDETTSEA